MLLKRTKQLKKHLYRLKERFENSDPPEHISDKDFFLQMKKETEPIFHLLEQWEEEALQFVKNIDVRIYPHQIYATKENIELLLLHSYYIDVRSRIYMEYYQSSQFILDQLMDEIKKEERG